MNKFRKGLGALLEWEGRHDERGATAVEYGLMVALIAAVIITAVALIGTNLTTVFNNIAGSI